MPPDLINIIFLIHVSILRTESAVEYHSHLYYGITCDYMVVGEGVTRVINDGVNVAFLVDSDPNVPQHYNQLLSAVVANIDEYYTVRYGASYNVGICLYSDVAVWGIRVGDKKKKKKKRKNKKYSSPISNYMKKHSRFKNKKLFKNNETELNATRIDRGLQAVEQELSLFANDVGFAPSMCILLITSPPDNRSLTVAAADSLKDSGVNIIVIAVGDEVDGKNMENLASNDKAVFTSGQNMSYSDEEIHKQAEDVTKAVSTALQHAYILPKYKWCYDAGIHIFMIVDLKQYHAQTMTQITDFLADFDLVFTAVMIIMINSTLDYGPIMEKLRPSATYPRRIDLEIFGSEYNLSSSIRRGRMELLTPIWPWEEPPPGQQEKLILVATDRSVRHFDDVIMESRASQESGIHIMTLGVGVDVSEDELSKIITDQRGIAIVRKYDDFELGLRKLYRNLCAGGCHRGWVYHDGMCFTYRSKDEPWIAAQKACKDLKAKLVSITTAAKYRWLKEEVLDKHNRSTHIGLRKHTLQSVPIGSEFRWENRTSLVFSDW